MKPEVMTEIIDLSRQRLEREGATWTLQTCEEELASLCQQLYGLAFVAGNTGT